MALRARLATAAAFVLVQIVLGEEREELSGDFRHVDDLSGSKDVARSRGGSLAIPSMQQRAPHMAPGSNYNTASCKTSECCAQNVSATSDHAQVLISDGVWIFLYGGIESVLYMWPRGRNASTILEEEFAIARGYCMTWNMEADNGVHARITKVDPTACTAGTAFRLSYDDYNDWADFCTYDNPSYKQKALIVTSSSGRRLNAMVVVPTSTPLDHKEYPPSASYIQMQADEMAKRRYCPEYRARVLAHLDELMRSPNASPGILV